jgi:hypothetical protein
LVFSVSCVFTSLPVTASNCRHLLSSGFRTVPVPQPQHFSANSHTTTIFLRRFTPNRISLRHSTRRSVHKLNSLQSQDRIYITTDGQSASLPWCQESICDKRPIFFLLFLLLFSHPKNLFLQIFGPSSHFHHMQYVLPISIFLFQSFLKYMIKSKNYVFPHYKMFSNLPFTSALLQNKYFPHCSVLKRLRSMCSSHVLSDKVSYPYKTICKIIISKSIRS